MGGCVARPVVVAVAVTVAVTVAVAVAVTVAVAVAGGCDCGCAVTVTLAVAVGVPLAPCLGIPSILSADAGLLGIQRICSHSISAANSWEGPQRVGVARLCCEFAESIAGESCDVCQ